MRGKRFLLVASLVLTLGLLSWSPAEAASSCTISATVCMGQSYVDTTTGGVAGALRCFFFDTDSVTGDHVCSSTQDRTTWQMNAGSCVTLFYFDVTQGAVPPATPNKVTLSVKYDNGATVVITFLSAGAEPANGASSSFCATADGTNTGAARAGTFRIYLNPVKDNAGGGVGNYNIDSDGVATVGTIAQSAKGAMRGNMLVSTLTASTPTGGVTFAYGSAADESVTFTATRSQKFSGTTAETVSFDARHSGGGSIVETTTAAESAAASTDTASIVIDNVLDSASTTYDLEYNVVSNAALTSLPWTTFPASGHGTGISQISTTKVRNTARFTADPRIKHATTSSQTFSGADDTCVMEVPAVSTEGVKTVANRVESIDEECFLVNARSQLLSRAMTFTDEDAVAVTCVSYGSTTPSANLYTLSASVPAGGTCAVANDATGAPRFSRVTNTNQNHLSVQSYAVSTLLVLHAHTQLPTTLCSDENPVSCEDLSFVISSDVAHGFCHVENVRQDTDIQVSGQGIAWNYQDPTMTTISSGTDNSGSNGWGSSHSQSAIPPSGIWVFTCTVASFNGNTGTDAQSINFVTAFTGNLVIRLWMDPDPVQLGKLHTMWMETEKDDLPLAPKTVPQFKVSQITIDSPDSVFDDFPLSNMVNVVDGTQTVNGALYRSTFTPVNNGPFNVLAEANINGDLIRQSQLFPLSLGDPLTTGLELGSTSSLNILVLVATAFFGVWLWTRWQDVAVRVFGAALVVFCMIMSIAFLDKWTPIGSLIVIFGAMGAWMLLKIGFDLAGIDVTKVMRGRGKDKVQE